MARKAKKEKQGMSVYPPYEVAPAVGAFKTTELTLSIRRDAHVMGLAAGEVGCAFGPAEWAYLAAVLPDRVIEPEAPDPGAMLAEVVAQAERRFGPPDLPGGPAGTLAERLRALAYHQAWAVLVAVRFFRDNEGGLADGARWWEMPARWAALGGAQEG
jgi:hypothetical protein